ncbi:MAG: nucleotidyltransferase domain-containing protein [Acidobacteria bacterium]|nr:nucleotidyltransferase domain-containing protein [Acidobacteriota bacterium]
MERVTPFTVETRSQLMSGLLSLARHDARLSGAAITGSAAAGREDRWSDIDLAFGVEDSNQVAAVLADFSAFMYTHQAIHHHDVRAGAWIYRVFFLPGGLQVDLALVPKAEFRPLGPAFSLVSGQANPPAPLPEPSPLDIIGLAWLHALHARSCILRRQLWRAEHMVSAVRDYTLTLACIRLGLPSAHGRGIDLLPASVTEPLLATLIGKLECEELWRSFAATLQSLATEIKYADQELDARASAEITGLAHQPPA